MYKPATAIPASTRQACSLTRADALEREITDLCAQINAAGYRLLQLIAELDDADPWGAWGWHPARTGSTGAAASA